ncbi:MAG: hypothetical protein ABFC80_04840 [Coriobacteriales bacterium]|nr:hypothetical protein [Actinomycetes bacterium]
MVYTKKDTVRVMVITKDHRIEGDMHVLEGSRLTDSLNSRGKDFYALTNARIYKIASDELIASPEYVAVARDGMTAVFPVDR